MMENLRLKFVPRFPGQIIGNTGIDVEEQDGTWTVMLDYTQFPLVSPYTPQPGDNVLVYDAIANIYFLVPVTSLT
jgi:hypothetical protein